MFPVGERPLLYGQTMCLALASTNKSVFAFNRKLYEGNVVELKSSKTNKSFVFSDLLHFPLHPNLPTCGFCGHSYIISSYLAVVSVVTLFFHDHILSPSHACVSISPFQPYYTNRASLPPNSGPRGVPQNSGARPVTSAHVYQTGPGSQMMMIQGQQLPFPSSTQGPAYFIPGQVGCTLSGWTSHDAGRCSFSIYFSLQSCSTDRQHTLQHPSNTQSQRERQASTQAPALLNMVLTVRGSSQGLTPATHTPRAWRQPLTLGYDIR